MSGTEAEDCDVDGTALRAGAGSGVGEVDVLGDVLPRKPDAAAAASGADRAVGVDGGDGPLGSVADHPASVGEEAPVVVACGDLVADVDRVGTGSNARRGRVELTLADAHELAVVVEFVDGVVRRRRARLQRTFTDVQCDRFFPDGDCPTTM